MSKNLVIVESPAKAKTIEKFLGADYVVKSSIGLEHEYGAICSYENLNVFKACWVEPSDPKNQEFADFRRVKQRFLATDKQGQMVFLADSSFSLQMTQQKYPSVKFHLTSEF